MTDVHDTDGETPIDISTGDCERKTDGTEADAIGPDSHSIADTSDVGAMSEPKDADPPESRIALLSRPGFAISSTWFDQTEFCDAHTPRGTPNERGTEPSAQPMLAHFPCGGVPHKLCDILYPALAQTSPIPGISSTRTAATTSSPTATMTRTMSTRGRADEHCSLGDVRAIMPHRSTSHLDEAHATPRPQCTCGSYTWP